MNVTNDSAHAIWRSLDTAALSNGELIQIICDNEAVRLDAWAVFAKRDVPSLQRFVILKDCPDLRDMCWQRMKEESVENATLVNVMRHLPELKEEAWELFRTNNPSVDDLLNLASSVPSLTEAAWQMLGVEQVSDKQLRGLVISSATCRNLAWQALKTRPVTRRISVAVGIECASRSGGSMASYPRTQSHTIRASHDCQRSSRVT